MSELLAGACFGLAVWMALNCGVAFAIRGRAITYTAGTALMFGLFAVVFLLAGVVIR